LTLDEKKRESKKQRAACRRLSLSLSPLSFFLSLSLSLFRERDISFCSSDKIFFIDGRPPYKGRKGDGGRWQAKLSEKTPDRFFFLQGLFIPKSLSLSLSFLPIRLKPKKASKRGRD
jgi:hypothetical protein